MYLNRIFFGFIAFIILLILVIVLFAGGGKKKTPESTPPPLTSYSNTDAQVIMNIDGAINGDDTHRAIRITIGQNSRELDVIQGYSGTVIQSSPNYNSQSAYNVFLHAINLAGFTLQRKGSSSTLDETGQCPLGERINFQLVQDGNTLSNLWTTSCGSKTGDMGGDSDLLQQLFQAQITNYENLTGNVDLSL